MKRWRKCVYKPQRCDAGRSKRRHVPLWSRVLSLSPTQIAAEPRAYGRVDLADALYDDCL